MLLYNLHDHTFKDSLNKEIIITTIEFIVSSKCFNCPLFSSWPISLYDASSFSFCFLSIFTLLLFICFLLYFHNLNRGVVSSLAWIQVYVCEIYVSCFYISVRYHCKTQLSISQPKFNYLNNWTRLLINCFVGKCFQSNR